MPEKNKKLDVSRWETDLFVSRHIGPREGDITQMLQALGLSSLDDLISQTIPEGIRMTRPLALGVPRQEPEVLEELKRVASQNRIFRSYIGMGYAGTHTPAVIQRNVLENPGWYTQYTPYQAEIAQGRLEALLNFQTLIIDLTKLQIANASLLDEATAAAEAMFLCYATKGKETGRAFFVGEDVHPQTLEVVRTRAGALGIPILVGDPQEFDFGTPVFGVLLQYPTSQGRVIDYRDFIQKAHEKDALVVMAADILSLVLLTPPGELGADVAIGSTQRLGVPMGFGGPHAAYFATRDEYKRQAPGRIVGVSQDAQGRPAIRLALQTREQHIRRDKATSNICTAQVLLAVMASMYAVYHGPEGLRRIAGKVHFMTELLAVALRKLGYMTVNETFFDTLTLKTAEAERGKIISEATLEKINLRTDLPGRVGISLDETVKREDLEALIRVFAKAAGKQAPTLAELEKTALSGTIPATLRRESGFLDHPVFNTHHSETEMLRYLFRLQGKDLSLATAMIPLGSCTMKLNATSEMIPVTWPEFGGLHPFVPREQATGYLEMFKQLEADLCEITGFTGVSLQPNAGSQGEYAGLLVIREYHRSRGDLHRDVCLIPRSAHGTNPASAVLAGMKVIVVECDSSGNVDVVDLKRKATEHSKDLAALMITYPSTHGVFEEAIREISDIVHVNGGQVYMDGANMNAQIGLCRPGDFGPDVCHLNLHKTFCIPHGGGGPGMGPIGVMKHLVPFLPGHGVVPTGGDRAISAVSAAPWGSASILPISWMYIKMMGAEGLKHATEVAILNANYIARRLEPHYPVLFKGKQGFVAHECIFDCRQFKETTGVEVEDIAKRLMDYGFHAPTISFPVAGTIMVEPTESEPLAELDRFCDAMIHIRQEIAEIQFGKADRKDNVLKNAPHTAEEISGDEWKHAYSREKAAFPVHWLKGAKFWPAVGRINNVLGDRNLVCACLPLDSYG